MAYSYSYHVGQAIVLVLQTGMANYYTEMLNWMMNVRSDPRFTREYAILCDFRDGTLELSLADAFTCGTVLNCLFKGQKIAFVVPDALKAVVSKLSLESRSAADVRDFSAMQDAENWLCPPACA